MTPTTFLVAAMGLEVVDHQLRCARVERLHAAQLAEAVMTVEREVHHLRAAALAGAWEPIMTTVPTTSFLALPSGGVAEPGVDPTRTGFEALTFLTFALEPGSLS